MRYDGRRAGGQCSLRSGNKVEHFFNSPHCGEQISMVLGPSVSHQSYVEDCEVCCRPIEITYSMEDDALVSFAAKAVQ
jgi:hypothetical protein